MDINIDSWQVKVAIVLALVGAREFVRLLTPKEATGAMNENGKWVIETLDSAAIAIGLVLFIIQPLLVQAFWIPSGSMEDTLREHDRLLVSKMVYRARDPRAGDVVVFIAPPEAQASPEEHENFIKRCIGTPGDIVYAKNRRYYRQSKGEKSARLLREPYVKWSPPGQAAIFSYDMKVVDGIVYSREYTQPGVPALWENHGLPVSKSEQDRVEAAQPEAIPTDKYLMLGDHRNNSNDSHAWGFVPRENVVGKAMCVFWPPTRVGLLDRMSTNPRPPAPVELEPQMMTP